MSGSLHKLVIHCFEDKDFKTEMKDAMFTVPINPESFVKNVKVELETRSATGSSGKDPKFKTAGTEELKLDFILDGTGTMEGYFAKKDATVSESLAGFLKCVKDVVPKTHRPPFLIIFWGSEIKFSCVLSTADINHTLFDPKGFPIRVRISATFIGYNSPDAQKALSKINSPDLTHYKKIDSADRLDLATYNIYNDSKYFLQIAKVNKLVSTRNIKPGISIYFPPFDKNENNG